MKIFSPSSLRTWFACLVAICIVIIAGYVQSNRTLVSPSSPAPSLSPTPFPIHTNEVFSSDATVKLLLESQKQSDDLTSYSVSTAKKSGEDKHVIFTTTEPAGSISIPRNTWSPDNKLVFIKVKKSDGLTFFVFKASGELFKNGEPYLDVGPLFSKKVPNYTMIDATGWGSEILLILSTETKEGKKGPLYWFEVPSGAFIQLAH